MELEDTVIRARALPLVSFDTRAGQTGLSGPAVPFVISGERLVTPPWPRPAQPAHVVGMSTRRVFLAAASAATMSLSCMPSPITGAELVGEGRKVLFIGNSYLYAQDIPGVVQAMASAAGGDKLAVAQVTGPDLALIDHWNLGDARRAVTAESWEWVVLQQGPSSVELNRDTLRLATRLFAGEMAGVKARPALFSAWQSAARRQDFDRAIESYKIAAADVSGLFLPVASAWLAAWRRDSTLQLYADGLHPSVQGAYLSSLVVYAVLLGKSPLGLPSQLHLQSGGLVSLDAATAKLLQEAAAEVTAR